MLQSLCAVRHAVACAPCSKLHGTDRASELESLTAVLWGCAHGSSPSMPVKGFHINMNTSLKPPVPYMLKVRLLHRQEHQAGRSLDTTTFHDVS